mgnify:CR=1 FL=1
MNDEIREILNKLKSNNYPFGIATIDINKLLDYITNLQKENERLETNCGELQNAIDNIAELVDVQEGMSIEDVYDKVKDYKSRVEKAVEYIKGWQSFPHTNCTTHNELKNLLNILQNGSDEE